MDTTPKNYFDDLSQLLSGVSATDSRGLSLGLENALDSTIKLVQGLSLTKGKLLFIGNGGSAAIASHQAVDYWKNGGIRAMAFNDASLLTCVSNDYGYAHVFEKPIEMFAQEEDTLFAISSSGKSENILRGVRAAQEIGCRVVTFSGFDKGNPLRSLGDINFYIASGSYGLVEISHLALSHYILDRCMELAESQKGQTGGARRFPRELTAKKAL